MDFYLALVFFLAAVLVKGAPTQKNTNKGEGMKPVYRPRKPREINIDGWSGFASIDDYEDSSDQIVIDLCFPNARQARKLAAWLIKAAEYLESRAEE